MTPWGLDVPVAVQQLQLQLQLGEWVLLPYLLEKRDYDLHNKNELTMAITMEEIKLQMTLNIWVHRPLQWQLVIMHSESRRRSQGHSLTMTSKIASANSF